MAEADLLRLGRGHRHFTLLLFGAGAVLLAFASLIETDRRGLLRWDRPTAFAAGSVKPPPASYDISYLGPDQARKVADQGGRRATRLIPLRDGSSGIGTPAGAFAQSALVAPLLPSNGNAGTGSTGTTAPNNTNPSAPGGPTAFTPSTLVDGGGTTPGVIVVDNPPVPAVPEPAAWLLMILGVGMLATALRRRAVVSESDSGETSAGLLPVR